MLFLLLACMITTPSQLIFYKNIHSPGFIEHVAISKNIDDFVKTLGNGDIVFSRSENFVGRIIQNSVKSIWNHVGMCIVCKETGVKCYWESSSAKDAIDLPTACSPMYGGKEKGVRMWPLKERLKHMLKQEGSSILFAVAKLTIKEPTDMSLYYKRLNSFVKKASGLPYQDNYMLLFFAWFDGISTVKRYICSPWSEDEHDHDMIDDRGSVVNNEWIINKEASGSVTMYPIMQKSYFCSQLIVDTLFNMGLMDYQDTPKCSEWTVDDLFYVRNINIHMKNGIVYKKPITFLVVNKLDL